MKPRAAALSITLALGLLVAPVPSDGQQPAKVYRIGWLGNDAVPAEDINPQNCPIKGPPYWQVFVEGLRERGYIPGQNLIIECRWTEGREERAPGLAAELVSLKPDLIIAVATANARAAKQATSTLPIVFWGVVEPVGRGLVASLAQPGGNVTGLTDTPLQMDGKRLQLLKEAVPKVSRVAVLEYSSGPPNPASPFRREREAAARALGVMLQVYDVRDPADFEGVFPAMAKARAEALFVIGQSFFIRHRQRIVELAAQNRLPAVYGDTDLVEAGGLLSLAVNNRDIQRRVAIYVDKILKGAKPADLPVEQPTKFELVVNLKTAKALGITIPASVLMRADEVIE